MAAAVGAVIGAGAVWYRTPSAHGAWLVIGLLLSVFPFVLVAALPRTSPLLLVVTAVPVVILTVTLDVDPAIAMLPAMALLLAVARLAQGPAIAVAVFVVVLSLVAFLAGGGFDWLITAFGLVVAWLGGRALGLLLAGLDEVHASSRLRAEEAALAERRRLAREVHDLVAHALTGTALSLAEVRLLLNRGDDRDAVFRALDQAEQLARTSLGDLRKTVRLLSEEGDPTLTPPIELEQDLTTLFDGYRRAGVDISFGQVGTPVALSVTSAWTTYRVVQESLTNAARHAPGAPVEAALVWGVDGLTIKVSSGKQLDGAPPVKDASDGRRRGEGIKGMSERVRLLGGRFAAGPTSSGWTVNAWVPAAPVDVIGGL